MGILLIPTLLGLAVTQINLTISTILASYFEGGPTYLFYAMRLIQFPLGIFGVAMATAILPSLATQAAKGAHDELRATVNFGLRMVFFIILPSMVGLMLLRKPIIHLFFEHGAFSALDTIGTASALLGFSVGLWAFASYRILAMAFYSLQDTRTPAAVAIVSVVINIGLSLWLMKPLAHTGLALAAGLAAIGHALILATILGHRIQGLLWPTLGASLVRTGIALLPVIGLCAWIASLPLWQGTGQSLQKMAWLLLAIGGSAMGYFWHPSALALRRTRTYETYASTKTSKEKYGLGVVEYWTRIVHISLHCVRPSEKGGNGQKSPSSKAAAILTRGAYWEYVSAGQW